MASTVKEHKSTAKGRVQEWAQSASHEDGRSIASRACIECTETLRALLISLVARRDMPLSQVRSYKQSCRSFILWVDGYDVHIGGLDEQMNDSPVLRRLIHRHLAGLSNLVAGKLVHASDMNDTLSAEVKALRLVSAEAKAELATGPEQNSDTEDSDDESDEEDQDDSDKPSTQSNLEEALEDFSNYVRCLYALGPMIEGSKPTPTALAKKKTPVTDNTAVDVFWSNSQPFEDSIQQRYKNAPPFLVKRLGKANLSRLRRLQRERETTTSATTNHGNINEMRTVAEQSRIDSGLGSSIAATSVYASTVMQYTRKDHDTVHIPQRPEAAKSGGSFNCEACGKSIAMKTDREWKQHLFQDLRPWVCVGPANTQCDEPFSSRQDWVQHLARVHLLERPLKSYTCPLCEDTITSGEETIIQHLAGHLEEISLGALLPHIDEDDSEEHADHDIEGFSFERSKSNNNEWGSMDDLNLYPRYNDGLRMPPWAALNLDQPSGGVDDFSIDTSSLQVKAAPSFQARPFEARVPIRCDECGKDFKSLKALYRHQRTSALHREHEARDGVYICKCGCETKRKDNFIRRHLDSCPKLHLHSTSDVFTCICQHQTGSAEDMRRHFAACSARSKQPRFLPSEHSISTRLSLARKD